MSTEYIIFLVMVFIAVFLLATSIVVPAFGSEAKATRRLRSRVNELIAGLDTQSQSLLKEKHRRERSAIERKVEALPGMERLSLLLEQAGYHVKPHVFVLAAGSGGVAAAIVVLSWLNHGIAATLAGIAVPLVALLKVRADRDKNLARFEEQLPAALDIMSRAMRAGHPFTETLKLVADEMQDPIAREFGTTFASINYGIGVKESFLGLLQRVPSISLVAMVTAVQVQRDTGGNLSEILDKTATVVRGRFRFQRRVRTLSAEGRLSGWILTLIPFVLAAAVSITSPDYLPMLIKDPLGQNLVMFAFAMIITGIFWIRRIIRIQV